MLPQYHTRGEPRGTHLCEFNRVLMTIIDFLGTQVSDFEKNKNIIKTVIVGWSYTHCA